MGFFKKAAKLVGTGLVGGPMLASLSAAKDYAGGGNLFGSPSTDSTSSVDAETAQWIRDNRLKSNDLYGNIMKQIGGIQPAADTAYEQKTGELSKLYPELMDQITNGTLPESMKANLSNLRNERVSSVSNDINNLIGSRMADYAGRGVTSSSTAEGVGGEAGKAMAPVVSQANQDYYQSLINMPTQMAQNRYNMASGYGTEMSNATMQKVMAALNPLFSMYGSTTGQGGATIGQSGSTTQNTPLMMQLMKFAPAIAGMAFGGPAGAAAGMSMGDVGAAVGGFAG
jgi:hypothetical protein